MHTSARARLERIERAMSPKQRGGIVVVIEDQDDPGVYRDIAGGLYGRGEDGEMRFATGEEVVAHTVIAVQYHDLSAIEAHTA